MPIWEHRQGSSIILSYRTLCVWAKKIVNFNDVYLIYIVYGVTKMPKFGVARKYAKDLQDYIVMLNQNKVDAYEMGFAYGIPESISDDIIALSKTHKVNLSCHLPFWINLGNLNKEKNINYLVSGLKIAERLESVAVFHLGFYGKIKNKPDELKRDIINTIQESLDISNVKNGKLGIETTGKQKAIGTVDEIIELIKLINDNRVMPIVDWSHLYARSNGTYPYDCENFEEVLRKIEKEIGYKPYYFHGGGTEYKKGNEVRHVSAKTHEPPLPYLFAALQKLGYVDFTFIVESPDSIEDLKWLKQIWKSPRDYFDEIPRKPPKTLFDFGAK